MAIKLQNYIFDRKKSFVFLNYISFLKKCFVYFDVHKKIIYFLKIIIIKKKRRNGVQISRYGF